MKTVQSPRLSSWASSVSQRPRWNSGKYRLAGLNTVSFPMKTVPQGIRQYRPWRTRLPRLLAPKRQQPLHQTVLSPIAENFAFPHTRPHFKWDSEKGKAVQWSTHCRWRDVVFHTQRGTAYCRKPREDPNTRRQIQSLQIYRIPTIRLGR